MTNFILLVAVTASATAEGVVAYHWTNINEDDRDEDLFKAVAGSTVSYFKNQIVYSVSHSLSYTDFWLSVRFTSVSVVHRDFLHFPLVAKITHPTQNHRQYYSRVASFCHYF